MNANRKSDDSIVPAKRANKTRTLAAELVEERGSPKGNTQIRRPCQGLSANYGELSDWYVDGK
jgi:hypothetical protein